MRVLQALARQKDAIKKLIAIRKSVGLTNQCTVNVLETTNNRYVAEVTGNNGKLLIKIGRGSYDPSAKGYSTADKVAGNALYSIWTKVAIKNLESQVAQLSFSPDGGTYTDGVKVTMDVANARISTILRLSTLPTAQFLRSPTAHMRLQAQLWTSIPTPNSRLW